MYTTGEKIKQILHTKQLTQTELAKIVGTTRQNVANTVGNYSKPNWEFLSKLSSELNVNLNWLIADIGEPFNIPPFEDVQDEFTARVRRIVQEELAKKRAD